MFPRVVLVCVASVALLELRTMVAGQCSDTVPRTMEFSLTSHKERSGKWVAEVSLEHGTDYQEAKPWKVDIQHSTVGCPGSSKVKLTAKITAPPHTPGPGYEVHDGLGYYKFYPEKKKSWAESKATCESEGAHLAIVNSEAEAEVFKEMFSRFPENMTGVWAFVGFHDMFTEGQFVTIFNEPINATGFTRWSNAGQPDNFGGSATNPGEDCGSIHRNNAGLNDLSCSRLTPFFCEVELV